MTVFNERDKVFDTGTGAKVAYDFNFKANNANEVKAKIDGELVSADDYTVTLDASGESGTLTFDTAPDLDAEVIIYRELLYTQETEVPRVEQLSRANLESMVDKAVMLSQQLNEIVSRAITVPVSADLDDFDGELPTTLTPRMAILVNAAGDGLVLSTYDPDTLQTAAATSATEAAGSATQAETSATASAASAAAAAASQAAAAASAAAAAVSAASVALPALQASSILGTSAVPALQYRTFAETRTDLGLGDLAVLNTVTVANGGVAAASAAAAGIVELADAAEMEAGIVTDKAVPPSLFHRHPAACKVWTEWNASGTILASYNTTSVTDSGTGNHTVVIATDFSGVDWAFSYMTGNETASVRSVVAPTAAKAAGSIECRSFDSGTTATDSTRNSFMGFGDHA